MLLACTALSASAQDGETLRARDLKNTAYEFYKQGDYDSAAAIFSKVQARQNELTTLERQDLRKLIDRNDVAMRGRREGGIQLRQAAEALAQNKLDEANRLLKLATSNQYLSKADTESLNGLLDQVRVSNRLTSPLAPTLKDGKVDYNVLMLQARDALKKGNLDRADQLAQVAEKAYSGPPAWMQPWSDNPGKIRREVQTARQAKAEPAEPAAGTNTPLAAVRRFLRGDEQEPTKEKKTEKSPAPKSLATPPPEKVVQKDDDAAPFSNIRGLIWPNKKPETTATNAQKPAPIPDTERVPAMSAAALAGQGKGSVNSKSPDQDAQFQTLAALPEPAAVQVDFEPPPTLPALTPAKDNSVAPARLSGNGVPAKDTVQDPAGLIGPDLPPPTTAIDTLPLPAPTTAIDTLPLPPTPPTEMPAVPVPPRTVPSKQVPVISTPTKQPPIKLTEPPAVVTKQPKSSVPTKQPASGTVDIEKKTVEVARALIKQGYIALRKSDVEMARKLAMEAKALRPNLSWDEPNPDRLLLDIRELEATRTANAGKQPATTPTTKSAANPEPKTTDARELVRRARLALSQGRPDDALVLCQQAEAAKKRWGLFEDSPALLQDDIKAALKRRDRAVSEKLLTQARQYFNAGDLEKARKLTWEAQKLYGTPGYWDVRRDRPDYLLAEIDRKERAQRPPDMPPPPELMPKNSVAQLPNAKPSATQVLKGQALVLLSQARELEKEGKLIEARERIMQASSLQATFDPNEDSPSTALIQLASKCDAQVNQLLREAETVTNNAKDSNRIQAAAQRLAEARKLSETFGLDGKRVDDKAQWLNNVVAGKTKLPDQVAKVQPRPETDPRLIEAQRNREIGLDLFAKGRAELKSGNTDAARTKFEEAYRLGVQEALDGVRSVDVEVFNQAKLSAYRNAEAGVDAYKRKDYEMARRIFAAVDTKLLAPEMHRLVREISGLREMQPGDGVKSLAKVEPQPLIQPGMPAPGSAKISDDPLAQSDMMEQFRQLQDIRFQKMRDRSMSAQRQAMELFQNKDVTKATAVLEQHLDELAAAQLSEEQTAVLRRQVEGRLQQYKTVQAQVIMANAQQELRNPGHDEGKRNRSIANLQQQVGDLMEQYRGLYKERKYKEAWVLAEQMKDLDPDNPAVTAAVHQAKYSHRYQEQGKISKDAEEFLYEVGQQGDWGPAGLSQLNPMHFDKDVMERIKNRKPLDPSPRSSKSEQELAIERQLQAPITVDFQNTPLEQVIDDLRTMSGVNIVPEYKALSDDGISLKQPLQLKVENVSLKSVLNMLLRQAGLTHMIKDGVLQVTTESRAKGKLEQRTFSVADLVVPVEDYALPSVYSYEDYMKRHIHSQTGQTVLPTPFMDPNSMSYGQNVSGSQGGMPNGQQQMGGRQGGNGLQGSKGSRLPSNTMDEQLIDLITNTIAPNTWDAVGGPGHIQYYPLGMALVVNQVQDVQEQVADLLAALRRLQDLQVAIEMRLVSVSESFFEMMGMDFDLKFLTHTRKYEPQLLTGQFQAPGYIQDFTPANFVAGLTPAGTFTPDLDIPLNQSSFGNSFPTFGGYPGLGNSGGLDIGLAFLSDIQVFMFLEAAQGDRRMNVMQAPKITVFNGQTAFITVQDQLFFLTGMNPVMTPQGPMFVAQHQAMPVGTQMQVTPVVSADRRFVRLAINQTMTNMLSATVPVLPVQVALPSIFINNSGATPEPNRVVQMFFQQPGVSVIAIQTTVNVPDGGTVLLGGLKFMAESRNESGPPVLSKIPYVNRIFKNVGWGREGATLMLMVTPRIIINEEEELIFRGELPPIPRP